MDDVQQKPFLLRKGNLVTYRDLQEENDELRANCQTLSRLVDAMRMEMEQVKRTHEVLPEQMPSGTQACLAHSVKSIEHFEEKSALDNGSTYEQDASGCTCNIGMKYVSLFDGIVDVDKSLVTWLRDVEVQCKHQKNRNAMAASLFGDKRISWMVPRTDRTRSRPCPYRVMVMGIWMLRNWLSIKLEKKNVRQIGQEEDYCSMDHIGKYPSYMYAGTVVLEKGDCVGTD
ncbi:hypothetical protein GUITHDRAFT_119677 [Guillardia theta CCMP2712]|uniref:Uncharacterized protein n=1 Tax=Guillardia theta (strain CCMP2712) TaxID=905079 RepID=L1IDD9_GUITC|nr:hypothetical protein GUITHDRAFT_119677 [Guillardia theta CCMP2712]EKX34122.1 hypothetical protein GUITHDRAFT_119677 [Guillardia theta CCMP2712]|eukprot:XP_005821102.1 hypothetical protein GUITHDRAFT_119677 [Guillardia theta CCMP2712]